MLHQNTMMTEIKIEVQETEEKVYIQTQKGFTLSLSCCFLSALSAALTASRSAAIIADISDKQSKPICLYLWLTTS